MFTFSAEQLREIGMRLFPAAGVQQHVAQEVVDSLVLSNLMEVDIARRGWDGSVGNRVRSRRAGRASWRARGEAKLAGHVLADGF